MIHFFFKTNYRKSKSKYKGKFYIIKIIKIKIIIKVEHFIDKKYINPAFKTL